MSKIHITINTVPEAAMCERCGKKMPPFATVFLLYRSRIAEWLNLPTQRLCKDFAQKEVIQ